MDRWTIAAGPAARPLPDSGCNRIHGGQDARLLLLAAEAPRLFPAPAVRARFMVLFADPRGHLLIALERDRRRIHGYPHICLLEDSREAPYAGPGAVLVNRLRGEISHLPRQRPGELCHPAFAVPVARRKRRFRSFLVIQHEAERHTRIVWPAHARNLSAIAGVVAAWPGYVLVRQPQLSHKSTLVAKWPAPERPLGCRGRLVAGSRTARRPDRCPSC